MVTTEALTIKEEVPPVSEIVHRCYQVVRPTRDHESRVQGTQCGKTLIGGIHENVVPLPIYKHAEKCKGIC